MGVSYQIRQHPVLRIPTAAQAAVMGEQKWLEAMKRRDQEIAREESDPLRYGYEPPVWRLPLALLDHPFWGDREWGARVRKALGFKRPVRVVLILGGNRSSKSEFGGKCQMVVLTQKPGALAWSFQLSREQSVLTHHKLFFRMLPPDMRRQIKSEVEYIAWKQETGFSNDKFVLRNRSEGIFKYYTMDKDTAMQGPEVDAFLGDELIPPDWVEDLLMRIASRSGFGLVTFTPVQGYSPTVRMFLDGSQIVLDQPAFLLPKDGRPKDVARALGFADERERERAHREGRWSEPTRFELRPPAQTGATTNGTEGRTQEAQGDGGGEEKLVCVGPEVPKGRTFEMMPRVARCVDENFAVVWFWSSDNPYGRPHEVVDLAKNRSIEFVRERVHGWAEKTQSVRFPRFSRKVHVVPASAIPKEGTNYHFVDPASGRNFVMGWFRVTQEGFYLYREWPGRYEIPGVGVPGPWAVPSGKHPDGKPGPAQKSFGWGLQRYKDEIARLEGWAKSGGTQEAQGEGNKRKTAEDGVEQILERRLDSRAASDPRMEKDRPRTLLTDFDDLDLTFELTPGNEIDEGVTMINDALDFDAERPVDFFNRPKFYVSEECENTIYALETWTGADGQKGACKDFVDIIRYFFLSDCEYVGDDFCRTIGGGHH
jgi:hypothetical protein